jgi:DNA replication protein DnaC
MSPVGNYGPPWGECARKLTRLVDAGAMVALLGTRGPGKTHMACAMIAEACRRSEWASDGPAPALYTKAMAIFLELRACCRSGAAASELDVLKRYRKLQLLVIDEIQERGETPFEDRILTYLLDERYAARKPTIMVGNLTPNQFAQAMGPSVADRLRETGCVLHCEWDSFRRREDR